MTFILDPALEKNSRFVTDLTLCQIRIQDEWRFPWILLIPKKPDIAEIIDLEMPEQHQLMDEIAFASHKMRELFNPDKLNIGALGNQVQQLHLHIIVRYTEDLAWPNPVWNFFELSAQYSSSALERRVTLLRKAFSA